jgi:hypothetical protein
MRFAGGGPDTVPAGAFNGFDLRRLAADNAALLLIVNYLNL